MNACVPNYPAVMSRKTRVWAKGVLSTGTAGFGFIYINPPRMIQSDASPIFSSDSAYAGNVIAAAGAGVQIGTSNSDYVQADFGTTADLAQARVVSCGLRIRYIGTELNRGGQIVGLQEPTHNDLLGYSFAALSAQERSRLIPVTDRQWITLCYFPVKDNELELVGDLSTLAGGYMAFGINAASAATPLSYEFEVYSNVELTGRNIRGLTPSHVDFSGFSAVHACSVTTTYDRPTNEPAKKREETFLQTVERYAEGALTWVGNNFGSIVTGVETLFAL